MYHGLLDPLAYHIDAFTMSWANELYLFPPFSLLPRVLQKLTYNAAEAVVILPD